MTRESIGFDIGGANIKWATTTGRSGAKPFALWKQPERLAQALGECVAGMALPHRLAITMTGELCDCFETRAEGVRQILGQVAQAFPGHDVRLWSTAGEFWSVTQALAEPMAVASANWHAQATYVGRLFPGPSVLMVDMGTTTTDIIPIVAGQPMSQGKTDYERHRASELLYRGCKRTPVCAIDSASFAEFFATSHDCFVALGELPEEPDHRETADGRPMTRPYALGRIAKCYGGDLGMFSQGQVLGYAEAVRERLVNEVRAALSTVIGRMPGRLPGTVVLCGSGEFFLADVLRELPTLDGCVVSMKGRLSAQVSEAFCAYAVAQELEARNEE